MKKILCMVFAFLMLMASLAFAFETALFDVRNNVFKEAQEMKPLLVSSKDMILLSSMWDSCIMAVTQLDAYFSMVGLFNAIKKEDLTESSIKYLVDWLGIIKTTNELNIKSLNAVSQTIDPKTKVHMEILKASFTSMNKRIGAEIEKVSALKATVKKPTANK